MQENELISLWKQHDKQLQENLRLNIRNTIDISRMKITSFLQSMRPVKIFTVLTGIVWVILVDLIIVYTFPVASPFFIISAIIQVLLTKVAIIVYIRQLILISQTDVSEPILETQERLAYLRSSTLWVTRILFLQLPVWTTFFLSTRMFTMENAGLVAMQLIITGFAIYASAWLFTQINLSNKDKKWFRLIFSGKEWTPIIHAIEVLEQVKDIRQELK